MTVSNTTSRNQYASTSGQTVFPYTFEVFDKNDIVVLQNDTTLSEGTDYTVSGVGNDNGGNVTLVVGATIGDIITIYRDMAYQRTTDYQTSGDFLAQEVNDDFDRLWLASQQNATNNNRTIRKPPEDPDFLDMELPAASLRANKYLSFGATGGLALTSNIVATETVQTGVFTPYFLPSTGSFGSITYSRQRGKYVRVGSFVYLSVQISLSALTVGTAAGGLVIRGLPYDGESISIAVDMAPISLAYGWTNAPAAGLVTTSGGAPLIALYKANGSVVSVSDMDSGDSNLINLNICHRTP